MMIFAQRKTADFGPLPNPYFGGIVFFHISVMSK